MTETPRFTVSDLCETDCMALVGWRYPPPYDLYELGHDFPPGTAGQDAAAAFFLDRANGYFAVRDATVLAGYCCFGEDAQVPGGDYGQPALDIGVGMRPDLTGQGHGAAFATAVIAFGMVHFPAGLLRVTVASFNQRSRRLWEKLGFSPAQIFVSSTTAPREFMILSKPVGAQAE